MYLLFSRVPVTLKEVQKVRASVALLSAPSDKCTNKCDALTAVAGYFYVARGIHRSYWSQSRFNKPASRFHSRVENQNWVWITIDRDLRDRSNHELVELVAVDSWCNFRMDAACILKSPSRNQDSHPHAFAGRNPALFGIRKTSGRPWYVQCGSRIMGTAVGYLPSTEVSMEVFPVLSSCPSTRCNLDLFDYCGPHLRSWWIVCVKQETFWAWANRSSGLRWGLLKHYLYFTTEWRWGCNNFCCTTYKGCNRATWTLVKFSRRVSSQRWMSGPTSTVTDTCLSTRVHSF